MACRIHVTPLLFPELLLVAGCPCAALFRAEAASLCTTPDRPHVNWETDIVRQQADSCASAKFGMTLPYLTSCCKHCKACRHPGPSACALRLEAWQAGHELHAGSSRQGRTVKSSGKLVLKAGCCLRHPTRSLTAARLRLCQILCW